MRNELVVSLALCAALVLAGCAAPQSAVAVEAAAPENPAARFLACGDSLFCSYHGRTVAAARLVDWGWGARDDMIDFDYTDGSTRILHRSVWDEIVVAPLDR